MVLSLTQIVRGNKFDIVLTVGGLLGDLNSENETHTCTTKSSDLRALFNYNI